MSKIIKKFSFIFILFVVAIIAVALVYILEFFTELSEDMVRLIAVPVSVAIGAYIDTDLSGEKVWPDKIRFSLLIGISGGIGILIANYFIF